MVLRMRGDTWQTVGTSFDGDLVFAVSAGDISPATPLEIEMLAQQVTAIAIERAVRPANGTEATPGLGEK